MDRKFSVNGRLWWIAFLFFFLWTIVFFVAVTVLFTRGVGIWGINVPAAWGFAITNFVWWIGIGHAGTFISAMLYLSRQKWRNPLSRFAETMTIFAVAMAGLFPILHLGRPQFFYWLIPYPNTMGTWPQFRSPLVWDLFAVLTYFTLSVLFWFLGLVPDLAILRDHAKSKRAQKVYGFFALGWRGTNRQWDLYQNAYLLLAGIVTPLVISVHSIVSLDFAVAIVPGWHSTVFPPYFVAGAIFSGFAMVITLGVPIRRWLKLENLITIRHLDLCARFMLAMGILVAYGYFMEVYMAFYSGEIRDVLMIKNRYFGPYWPAAWIMIFCNCVATQSLWSSRVRQSPRFLFILSLVINVGMWLERFVIIVPSLSRDYLPSSWHIFVPTIWDFLTLFGSIGFFFTLFLLFLRFLPAIAITECWKEKEIAGV